MNGTKKLAKHLSFGILLCLLLFTFTGAKRKACKPRLLSLTSIHIIDRNGFTETISNKERLNQFQLIDFLKSQPYQKVLRIYERDSRGQVRSVVNTYHENGNPKQFLEIVNARAQGTYCEWHENGSRALSTKVIGGTPDVTEAAEKTWLFDGISCAWNEEGQLVAEISYNQGSLEGPSLYYHANGQLWKRIPYIKNQVEGMMEIYTKDGELLSQASYSQGIRHGCSYRYWDSTQLASQEEFHRGKLSNAQYYDQQGVLLSEVKEGTGYRIIFSKDSILEIQEYSEGVLEGEVKVFNKDGRLKRLYHIKNGIKHGEEVEYYDRPFNSTTQPRLSFHWYDGKIQGIVKSWYPDGIIESQRDMSNNKKNGLLTAWYRDGNLMMIEEYENGKLIRGDYFKKGDKLAVTQVNQGKGTATIYDAEGHFVQKITYNNGKPGKPGEV